MSSRFSKFAKIVTLLVWVLVPVVVLGGSINTFSNGTTLDAARLNYNFNHLHNNMIGAGHDTKLVDADVSATANIAHSKLATPYLIPKAWAFMPLCSTPGPCATSASHNLTVTRGGTAGQYTFSFADTTHSNYGVVVTGSNICVGFGYATTGPEIRCYDNSAVAQDSVISIVIWYQ